jgi:hypothetical protein
MLSGYRMIRAANHPKSASHDRAPIDLHGSDLLQGQGLSAGAPGAAVDLLDQDSRDITQVLSRHRNDRVSQAGDDLYLLLS